MPKIGAKQKIWEINTLNIQDKQIMEICKPKGCSNLVQLYYKVLQDLLSKWPVLLASQIIDIRELSVKEIFNLLSTAINDNDISITMTKEFTDRNILKEYTDKFAIHIFSNNSVNWVPSVLRFGSVSLPHIVYCYKEINELVNINLICQMNLQFINWFQSSIGDEQIINLGEKIPLIYWVGDFRMYFFTSRETINYLREIVNKIASEYDLQITFTEKCRK